MNAMKKCVMICMLLLLLVAMAACSEEDPRMQWEDTLREESYSAITQKLGQPDRETDTFAVYANVPLGNLEGEYRLMFRDDEVIARQFIFYVGGNGSSPEECRQQADRAMETATDYLTGEYGNPRGAGNWSRNGLELQLTYTYPATAPTEKTGAFVVAYAPG